MVETTSYLTFVPLKDDQNMTIECEAINDVMAEPITTEENLDIYYAPRVMILDDNVTAVEGDDVMIDCDIDSNPDDNLTVTWYLDDQPLESYTIDSTDVDTLTLVSVSRDEAGHYSCSV